MKKIISLLLVLAMTVLLFASCGECNHVDDDKDSVCDKCKADLKKSDDKDDDKEDDKKDDQNDEEIDSSKFTEDQWKAAFNKTNVTITVTQTYKDNSTQEGTTKSDTTVYCIAGGNLYGYFSDKWSQAPAGYESSVTYTYDFSNCFSLFTYVDGEYRAERIEFDFTNVASVPEGYEMTATNVVLKFDNSGNLVSASYCAEASNNGAYATVGNMLIELSLHGKTPVPDADGGNSDDPAPDKPAEPNEPEIPGEPTDPGEEPAEPGEPTDPGEEPAEPGEPTDPGEKPGEPGEPTDPGEKPVEPGEPTEPGEKPVEPGEPTEPNPGIPVDPTPDATLSEDEWRDAFNINNATLNLSQSYYMGGEFAGSDNSLYRIIGNDLYMYFEGEWYQTSVDMLAGIGCVFDFSEDFNSFTVVNGEYIASLIFLDLPEEALPDGYSAFATDVIVIIEGGRVITIEYTIVMIDAQGFYNPDTLHMLYSFSDYDETYAPDVEDAPVYPSEPDEDYELPDAPGDGYAVTDKEWEEAFDFDNVTVYMFETYSTFEDDVDRSVVYIIDGNVYIDLFGGGNFVNVDEFDFSAIGADYDFKALLLSTISFAEYYSEFSFNGVNYYAERIDKSTTELIMIYEEIIVNFGDDGRVRYIAYNGNDGEDSFSGVISFVNYGTSTLPDPPEAGIETYDKSIVNFEYPGNFVQDSLEYTNQLDGGMSSFMVEHAVTDSFDIESFVEVLNEGYEQNGFEDIKSSYEYTRNDYISFYVIEHTMNIYGVDAHTVMFIVENESGYTSILCVMFMGADETFVEMIHDTLRLAD